ncbi:FtsQ-type POTRA domain-containing protein [Microbacterium sp. BWT-B31]|uniref:FtsQ-type POTRA domain-containing protein n=1 Tax=Microbacterium sp. BWT-B31 TaxID=3232072 RepID=UPI003529D37B
MRRPSPLPTPPAPAESVTSGRTDAAPAGDPGEHARPVGAAPEVAPVIPLSEARPPGAPSPLPDSGRGSGAATQAEAGPDAAPDEVRLRDVWRSARARRKALRSEIRRFTVRQRRRRLLWTGVAASLVLLVLGTLGAAYSPLFAVETIHVVGTQQLDAAAVEASLSDQLGTPLPLVDDSAVKAALVGFPLVESYRLEARPPHDLVVRIVERTPIGVVQTRAGFSVVDAAGVTLSTSETPVAGMPMIEVPSGIPSPSFTAVGLVVRSLPADIPPQVTVVSASSPDDVVLTLGGANARIVWGSAEHSAKKALVLKALMAQRPPDSVSVYDVSAPEAATVR